MSATAIYDAMLEDVEIRKHIHPKHLRTYRSFFEGLRIVKKNLGLYNK